MSTLREYALRHAHDERDIAAINAWFKEATEEGDVLSSTKICTRSDCERNRAETGECHCSVYGEPAWTCPDCGAVCLHARSVHRCDPEELIAYWAVEQFRLGRKLVALISPDQAHDGPRYAGYYCIDGPEPL